MAACGRANSCRIYSIMTIDDLHDLYAYNRWANRLLLDAVEQLDAAAFTRDLGSSFPSVRDTLAHVLAAEWVWLQRWRGTSPDGPPGWDASTLKSLRQAWRAVEEDQRAFVDGLLAEDLDRSIAYRNTAGSPFTNRLADMLRHVVNHSSYHRGQVVTMLRQLGATAVSTDLIRWYREGRPA